LGGENGMLEHKNGNVFEMLEDREEDTVT